MPQIEKTVQDLLAEITKDYQEESQPTSYFQRGILSTCERAAISDYRLVKHIFQVVGIDDFTTKSLNHLKVHTGSSERSYLSIIIDSINSSLIYSLISLDPIQSSFEERFTEVLQPQKRTVKKLEF